jgi:hypothetical protein
MWIAVLAAALLLAAVVGGCEWSFRRWYFGPR